MTGAFELRKYRSTGYSFEYPLSEEERAAGYALFCQSKPCSDLEISVRSISRHDSNAIKTVNAKIYKITRVTDDVSVLQLRFPAGTRVPFKAGQYLQIVLEEGSRRCYSRRSW